MITLLLTYWPVLLLLHVPRLAQTVAVVIATRLKGTLDHQIPDDLPQTAGEWLATRLAALRLDVTSLVTDKQADAYRPFDRVIQLHHTTHFKPDPVYWATAAHELGHARVRAELPAIGHLRLAANLFTKPLLATGVAGLAAYMLYAIALGGHIAFACFAVASALRGFVLLDEALASIYAYRELRANPAIDLTHLRAIRSVLAAAFLTYFVTYASYALLLAQWSLLDALVTPLARAELTTLGWIAAFVLTAGVVVTWRSEVIRWIPVVLLLALVWNVVAPAYTWCVIAAVLASWQAWHRLAHLPFGLAYGILRHLVEKLQGPGLHETPAYLRQRARGAGEIAAGNRRLEELAQRWKREPHPVTRVFALARFACVPLLVAIWL